MQNPCCSSTATEVAKSFSGGSLAQQSFNAAAHHIKIFLVKGKSQKYQRITEWIVLKRTKIIPY